MYVCICKGLTEYQLIQSIQEIKRIHGNLNLILIQNYTGATTKCGCCKEEVEKLIKDKEKFLS